MIYRFDLASKRVATLAGAATAAMPDLLTDTLYRAEGTDVVPMYRGAVEAGRWRSRLFVRNTIDGFGWAQVGGDFADTVTLRLYAEAALHYTVSAPADTALRLPFGRWREWEIEIEGVGELSAVTLAGSAEELKQTGALSVAA